MMMMNSPRCLLGYYFLLAGQMVSGSPQRTFLYPSLGVPTLMNNKVYSTAY
jgi:hypothetical protein